MQVELWGPGFDKFYGFANIPDTRFEDRLPMWIAHREKLFRHDTKKDYGVPNYILEEGTVFICPSLYP